MSKEAFETVIGKALLEAEFRNSLLADPDRTLAGFELTEGEKSVLKRFDGETLDSVSQNLEERTRMIRYPDSSVLAHVMRHTGKTSPPGDVKSGKEQDKDP